VIHERLQSAHCQSMIFSNNVSTVLTVLSHYSVLLTISVCISISYSLSSNCHSCNRDAYRESHGTHVAATAVGNTVAISYANGSSSLAISGMAPRARLAVYKVSLHSLLVSAGLESLLMGHCLVLREQPGIQACMMQSFICFYEVTPREGVARLLRCWLQDGLEPVSGRVH